MGSLSDYFARTAYQATFVIGDRVQGKWNNIPFVGSVGNDRLVNLDRGPEVTVHLDLPILFDQQTYHVILVPHSDVKPRK